MKRKYKSPHLYTEMHKYRQKTKHSLVKTVKQMTFGHILHTKSARKSMSGCYNLDNIDGRKRNDQEVRKWHYFQKEKKCLDVRWTVR